MYERWPPIYGIHQLRRTLPLTSGCVTPVRESEITNWYSTRGCNAAILTTWKLYSAPAQWKHVAHMREREEEKKSVDDDDDDEYDK